MAEAMVRPGIPLLSDFFCPIPFLVSNRSLRFFWGLLRLDAEYWWGPPSRPLYFPPIPSGFSIEFLDVGGWLSTGDLASGVQGPLSWLLLNTVLSQLGPDNVTTQFRKARRSSVWAPSCQDVTPGGHAGVGVISLHGAPLSLPTLSDPSFKEFFRIGRAMRVILPLGNGGVVHLFVICGYQELQLSETSLCCSLGRG